MDNKTIWKLIDKYFGDNPQCLVRHQVDSYNDFLKNGIYQIFKEKNQINIATQFDDKLNDYRGKAILHFGGKDGTRIYIGKPIIFDDDNTHYMFPNEARLRNMTYGITIHYDVEVEIIDILDDNELPTIVGLDNYDDGQSGGVGERGRGRKAAPIELTTAEAAQIKESTKSSMISQNTQKRTLMLEKILLGRFPIMVQSNQCILAGLPREARHNMGECLNDIGGYFIIDGKEKTVVSQETFGNNMLYIRHVNDESSLYSAEIKSVSENVSKPVRTLSVRLMTPTSTYTMMNIVVNIPNVRKPVPLFIVFRALGIISDKHIITMCLLDLDKYESMVDLFSPSVHDSGGILTQRLALIHIGLLTRGKTITHALEILADYFLPHVGEVNYIQKGYYLGYMVFRLLSVYTGIEQLPDRDSLKYKRVELVGTLMRDLFRDYYNIQQQSIKLAFETKILLNQNLYAADLYKLITTTYPTIFNNRIIEAGFKKAFKGNWGAHPHTKRIGVIQDLNRLSYIAALSHLRKTNLPLDPSVKVVGPRVLHNTHWGFFDPIDTPDGGNIGLHKQLAISTYVTQPYSREPLIEWLREHVTLKLLEECNINNLSESSKVFVNGYWAGIVDEPIESVQKIKLFRRNGLIPIYTSVVFDYKQNSIFIYTDGGRICRPIFYVDDDTHKLSFDTDKMKDRFENNEFSWEQAISGFNDKKKGFNPNDNNIYKLNELYENVKVESNPAVLKRFIEGKSIIDYIDTNETDGALISLNSDEYNANTNLKMINYTENNPAVRNSFSCGQSKQSVSLYHTNYQMRMDKTAVVLSYGQTPLVKTRYLEYINREENPYGENPIVAVMCYTGYNVEDAILVNEASLKRGMFRTTYFSTYETHEEKTKVDDYTNHKTFTNVESDVEVIGTKTGYDYSKLDKYGIIRENTEIDEKSVLIGLVSSNSNVQNVKRDMSKTPKKGQIGIVDKTFITEGEEGTRIAKVRIREERIPCMGDKMASRAGQKGTIGLVVPEADMPFNADGLRPDLIINPHAIPSRMTIGQFVETITGKACSMYGGFGDCTAYNNRGTKSGIFGNMLTKVGYHSSGNEILYNGMTGEQLEVNIFMGPNYYMRLKHMVKDKINYRARGPNTALTRQPVSGRANDGGLRIGEMERDSVISHGASEFLRESMMERADNYKMAICNVTGAIAIYNPNSNIFMSPMADGPVKFKSDTDLDDIRIDNISKYGRSFSIVAVPYSLKLLMQELQTINVQMRIVTEDNIEQFDNMSYSKNINLLLSDQNATAQTVINMVKTHLANTDVTKLNTPIVVKTPDALTPQYEPRSLDSNASLQSTSQFDWNQVNGSPNDWNPLVDSTGPQTPNTPPPDNLGPQTPDTPPPDNLGPQTPNTSPPYMVGGGGSNNFQIGDDVYLIQDANRIWQIIKIGDNLVTIKTNQSDNLPNSENIKIVPFADIYRSDEMPISQEFRELYNNASYNEPYNASNHIDNAHSQHMQPSAPQINIKITNGPDNSSGSSVEPTDIAPADVSNVNAPIRYKADAQSLPNDCIVDIQPDTNDNIFKNGMIIKKLE